MRIFMGYAAKDAELASQLTHQLLEAGFEAWDPAEQIAPGDNWAKKIGQALDESDVLLTLITRDALQSEDLRGTIQYGLTSEKFAHRFVPVLVGYVTFQAGTDVPWILLKMDPVFLESPLAGFNKVIRRIQAIAQHEANVAR